jgi:hypothetical protein
MKKVTVEMSLPSFGGGDVKKAMAVGFFFLFFSDGGDLEVHKQNVASLN